MILGLSGLAGSGKDTAADAIIKQYPGFNRYALAGPIKEVAEQWLGLTQGYMSRDIKESLVAFDTSSELFDCLDMIIYEKFCELHPLITMKMSKKISQSIYDHVMKDSMYLNLKATKLEEQILVTTPRRILQLIGTEGFRDNCSQDFWLEIAPRENCVITDIRFNNEAEWFSQYKGSLLLGVSRDMEVIKESNHKSEKGVDSRLLDDVLYNNTSIKEFQVNVLETVSDHLSIHNMTQLMRK